MSKLQQLSTITKDTAFEAKPAEMMGMEPEQITKTTDGTMLTSLATVAEIASPVETPMQGGINTTNIVDYLSRPYPIKRGAFTNGARANVDGFAVDATYFTNMTSGNASGSLGIRATVCVRVDVSAAPQVSGIVKLGYIPFTTNAGFDRGTLIPLFAQLPNVELNLAEGSSVEIKVPYIFDRDYFNFNSTDRLAYVYLVSYAPVAWDSTVTTPPTYVLYTWLEDVKLVGRAATSVATVTPQGMEKLDGPVSGILSRASTLTRYIGEYVPAISAYTKPVSWAMTGFAKLAAHFGWSKPNDGSWSIMGPSFLRGFNTALDVGQATEMGYYANNEVAPLPGFAGTDIDEMSLCYLTCRPGCLAYFHLLTTDTANTYKWSCPINPNRFYFYKTATNIGFAQPVRPSAAVNSCILPTPIMAVTAHFGAWRGDIVFRFKFARTKFHGGRVLIGYNPVPGSPDGSLPSDTRYNYLSVVVDLRVTSEIEFVVPFTYHRAFCKSDESDGDSDNTGNIFMRVIDPIYAPAGVVSYVPVVVEVYSMCGYELAHPQPSSLATAPVSTPVFAQSEVQYTMGEDIRSLKQLLLRPTPFAFVPLSSAVDTALYAWFTYGAATFATRWQVQDFAANNRLSDLMSWFGLWRGSLVWWYDSDNDNIDVQFGSSVLYSDALMKERRIMASARFPYYSCTNRTRTPYTANGVVPKSLFRDIVRTNPKGAAVTGTPYVRIHIACGDDFQLGQFICVPPMVTTDRQTAAGVYASVTPQGLWKECVDAVLDAVEPPRPSAPVSAVSPGGFESTAPPEGALVRPPSPRLTRAKVVTTELGKTLLDVLTQ
jgi:hypothetical protein